MMNLSLKSLKFPRSITDVAPVNCCTWSNGWVMKALSRKPCGYLRLNSHTQPNSDTGPNSDIQLNLSRCSIQLTQTSQAPYCNFDHSVHFQSPIATPKPQYLGSQGEILKGRILLCPVTPCESSQLDNPDHPGPNTDPTCQSLTGALGNPSPFQSSGLVPDLMGI